MDHSKITAHLRCRAELLLSGQFDRLADCYHYPLPVFMLDSRLVIHAPQQARLIFRHLRDALQARGVVALHPIVSAVDLPRAGRFRVWVDWQEIAVPTEATRVSQAVYYCRATALGQLTEMISYTRLSMPELNQQIVALARTA